MKLKFNKITYMIKEILKILIIDFLIFFKKNKNNLKK